MLRQIVCICILALAAGASQVTSCDSSSDSVSKGNSGTPLTHSRNTHSNADKHIALSARTMTPPAGHQP
jgi:hypothetical protein